MGFRRFLKILDPTYGLYLHWKWEREGRGSLLDHLLCGLHASSMISLWVLAFYYLTYISLVSRDLALVASLTYGIGIMLIASVRARR